MEYRHLRQRSKFTGEVSQFGGLTLGFERVPEENIVIFAAAMCTDNDTYSKPLGRQIVEKRIETDGIEIELSDIIEWMDINSHIYFRGLQRYRVEGILEDLDISEIPVNVLTDYVLQVYFS